MGPATMANLCRAPRASSPSGKTAKLSALVLRILTLCNLVRGTKLQSVNILNTKALNFAVFPEGDDARGARHKFAIVAGPILHDEGICPSRAGESNTQNRER